jgi:endoglucanase
LAHDICPIAVNQIGYPARAAKIACFTKAGEFRVVDAATGETVFTGRTGEARPDANSGVSVAHGDFTGLTAPGRYRIEMDGQSSAGFEISERPYDELHRGLLKAFYYFRCGMDLVPEYAGPWTHGACHRRSAAVYGEPGRRVDGSGGWHDAGDYGKYTVPAAKAVADLLLAYECYPEAFRRPVPIPETDGRMPDVLHECRYELDFLFRMQDERTGGVHHKLTTLRFPPLNRKAEEDLDELYVMPVSPTATADFAAVMALASRICRPFDPAYADRCLAAARRAWDWLARNPDAPGYRNPPDVFTGEYGDRHGDRDERYWAAAELYRATGEDAYREAFLRLAREDFDKFALGWADMGGYGTIAWLLNGRGKGDNALYDELLDGLRAEADRIAAIADADGYRVSLERHEYVWGSNMLAMNDAMLLLIADRLLGGESWRAAALDQIHYLLGRNVLGISFVTGFGERAYRNPHYRPGVADGVDEPVPGFVSGGPNAGLHDDCMRRHLQGKPPAQCYIDHRDSYAGNEVTIYWNSPAVFAVSAFVG